MQVAQILSLHNVQLTLSDFHYQIIVLKQIQNIINIIIIINDNNMINKILLIIWV